MAWRKPIMGDVNLFLWWARGIVETGTSALPPGPDEAPNFGNMHPPAYLYALVGSFALFGSGPGGALAVNLACLGVVLGCLRLISRASVPNNRTVFPLAAAVLLIHPYAIQASLLTDIDTSVMPAAMLAYVAAFVRWADGLTLGRTLGLGALFGMTLLTKLTTPLILPVATGAFLFARGQPRAALRVTTAVTLTGIAVFLGALSLFVLVSGFPTWEGLGWGFSKARSELGKELGSRLAMIAATLKTDVLWYGAPFLLLLGLALARRLRAGLRPAALERRDFIWIVGLSVYLAYTVVMPSDGVPRYKAVTLPLFAFLVADVLAADLRALPAGPRAALPALALGASLAYFMAGPEVITAAVLLGGTPSSAEKARLVTFALLPLAAVVAAWATLPVARRTARVTVWVAAVFAAYSGVTDVRQASAEHPNTFVGIGQRGFAGAVDYLRRHTRPGEVILSHHAMPYYSGNRFYHYFRFNNGERHIDIERIRRLVATTEAHYLVVQDPAGHHGADATITPAVRSFLAEQFCLVHRRGDFAIYRVRRGSGCPEPQARTP